MMSFRFFLLGIACFINLSCATQEQEQELEPGCLDVIICSEPVEEEQG
jgi:hypothetical protein